MQALSMIDMGTQVPEINSQSKPAGADDQSFKKVLTEQQQPEKNQPRKTEAAGKPVGQKSAEKPVKDQGVVGKNDHQQSRDSSRPAEKTETSGAKVSAQAEAKAGSQELPVQTEPDQLVAGELQVQIASELEQLQARTATELGQTPSQGRTEQGTAQHLIIDLLQALSSDQTQSSPPVEGAPASIEELLTLLVQQLDQGQLPGKPVLAGVDLTSLVGKLQELAQQQDAAEQDADLALKQLVQNLMEQLDQKTDLDANSDLVAGMMAQPVHQMDIDPVNSQGKARQLLQQAINAVTGQQPVTDSQEEVKVAPQDVQPAAEKTQPLTGQPAEKEIDPRFAGLLKPRSEGFAVESLRERVQGQVAGSNSGQELPAAEQPVAVAEGTPEQEKAAITNLLNSMNSDPKQPAENLLRQAQENHQPVLQPNTEASQLKQTPTEVRMLNLPSGQQVAESQVFDQVVARMSGSLNGESGRMVLRLHPAELGSLRLELSVEGERVRAHLHAQNQQVQEVLERNLPQLRSALAEQGLKIDQFQVNVDQRNSQQGQFDNLSQQQQRQDARQQKTWQQGWQQEEQIIPLAHLMQNGGGGISLHV